jgi:hypothetical protein
VLRGLAPASYLIRLQPSFGVRRRPFLSCLAMHQCEECGAQYPTVNDSCSRRFQELLALDHSRQEPWGSRHGQAFAVFALQHPQTHERSLDAAWDVLFRIYCLNEPPSRVIAARRRKPNAPPVTGRGAAPITRYAVTIADLGTFSPRSYAAALDVVSRDLAAWGAPSMRPPPNER